MAALRKWKTMIILWIYRSQFFSSLLLFNALLLLLVFTSRWLRVSPTFSSRPTKIRITIFNVLSAHIFSPSHESSAIFRMAIDDKKRFIPYKNNHIEPNKPVCHTWTIDMALANSIEIDNDIFRNAQPTTTFNVDGWNCYCINVLKPNEYSYTNFLWKNSEKFANGGVVAQLARAHK